jgi:NTP pyrophosphatase (non-canonical NTP hydrolase)
MFNDKRCFLYNKALAEYLKEDTPAKKQKPKDKEVKVFKKIRQWATDRGLYVAGDPITQYVKLQEEAGELAQALLKDDQPEVIDAIGDMVVVLTNLAHQRGVSIEHCINSAYEVIAKRKGKMINGTFVKETL